MKYVVPHFSERFVRPALFRLLFPLVAVTLVSTETMAEEGPVYYVDAANATPAAPYDTRETAATSLYDVLAQAENGSTVWVAPGEYPQTTTGLQHELTNAVRVIGESGNPDDVVIGYATVPNNHLDGRNFFINNPGALLANVTLKNGKAHSPGSGENRGGNILMFSGTVSNCVLRNGESYNAGSHGGGLAMTDGYATRLIVTGSKLARRGNGIAVAVLGGVLDNSLIMNNRQSTDTAQNAAFSMLYVSGGTARNCTVLNGNLRYHIPRASATAHDAGLFVGSNGKIVNTVVANMRYYDLTEEDGDIVPPPFTSGSTQANFVNCACDLPDIALPNETCVAGPLASLFKNFEGNDYTPAASGVLFNAGASYDGLSTALDLAGSPRVSGRAVDIGALEGSISYTTILIR